MLFLPEEGARDGVILLFDHKSTPGFLPRSFAVPHLD